MPKTPIEIENWAGNWMLADRVQSQKAFTASNNRVSPNTNLQLLLYVLFIWTFRHCGFELNEKALASRNWKQGFFRADIREALWRGRY